MATIKICDRCGSLIEPMSRISYKLQDGVGYAASFREADMDICSVCKCTFQAWLNGGTDEKQD